MSYYAIDNPSNDYLNIGFPRNHLIINLASNISVNVNKSPKIPVLQFSIIPETSPRPLSYDTDH
jgi:hypothetical protein